MVLYLACLHISSLYTKYLCSKLLCIYKKYNDVNLVNYSFYVPRTVLTVILVPSGSVIFLLLVFVTDSYPTDVGKSCGIY
jgi:hypothetical protein